MFEQIKSPIVDTPTCWNTYSLMYKVSRSKVVLLNSQEAQ